MDTNRRRGIPARPASTEEIECWRRAANSLSKLSNEYCSSSTMNTIGRVNRLMRTWPDDDTPPAQGIASLKSLQQKLKAGLSTISSDCDSEIKAIDEAEDILNVLIALRKAPEMQHTGGEKRNKRPRGSSPATPIPASGNSRSMSITVPPRTNSVGPRDSRSKKDSNKNPPLQQERKVAFRPPAPAGSQTETDWILAIVKKYLGPDKNGQHKYTVQDAEPQDDGQPGATYTALGRAILPLPDPDALPGSPAHIGQYPDFIKGSMVMAMYPDTSCFYRAEVVDVDRSPAKPMYKVKFDDDDDQVHNVKAHLVIEYPSSHR